MIKTALILEDVPESQAWLAEAMATAFPGITLHSADSLADARQWLGDYPAPDMALIDLGLPDGNGVELITELNRDTPQTFCIVASIYDSDQHLFPALRAGARGYLLKDQPLVQIVELLKGIVEGRPPLSPAIARKLLGYFQPTSEPDHTQLTKREAEVLRCIARGFTLAETGNALSISPHTVSGYVKDIYRKINVSCRAEAALAARNMGLV